MGMAFEILKAGGDIVYQPYKAYRSGGIENASISSLSQAASPQQLSPVGSSLEDNSTLSQAGASELEKKGSQKLRDVITASGLAGGKFLGKCVSGVVVDVPLAAAEGFRVLPGLYGDKVYEHQKVKDWKSGAIAGVKGFAIGMGESAVDPLWQPFKGARDGGVRGFAGGMFKGTFGVIFKMTHGKGLLWTLLSLLFLLTSPFADFSCSAASLGLVAYPGQGLKRSIQASFHQSTRTLILASLHEDGRDLTQQWRSRGFQDGIVVEKFQSRSREDTSDYDSDYM